MKKLTGDVTLLKSITSELTLTGALLCMLCDTLSHLGVGIELSHCCVVKVGVDDMLPAGGGGRPAVPGAVAHERRGGDQDVGGHKDHQDPGGDVAGYLRDFLDPPCKVGVQPLDPYNSSNAPEEAVQKIDAASQVEGDIAVVPENLAEHQL